MNQLQINARSATRFQALTPAVLHAGGQEYPCEAANLSRTGVLLLGELPRPAAPHVRITLFSPARDLQVNLAGLLARIDAHDGSDPGPTELAVRFCGVSGADRVTLEALVSRSIEGATAVAALGRLLPNASKPEIVERLKQISLPHRVALAVRAQPRERELLLNDPSPQVIDALARNPQLGPHELQAILRVRTLSPTALESLARDPRWRSDERVRVQIATHTNTPPHLAETLALELSPASLARVIQASSLNDALRQRLLRRAARSIKGVKS